MIQQIQTELPIWLALIGLMLAIFLSLWSYTGKRNGELFSKTLRIFLGAMRGLGFFLVFILFVGLLWKKQSTVNPKPIYVIAVDNSKSILIGEDSVKQISELNTLVESIQTELGNMFIAHSFEFGTDVSADGRLSFDEQSTNFGKLFSYLRDSYYAQPVKELLLITDGISTAGASLISSQSKWPFPVSVLALGDTTESVDLRIEEVTVNDLVYQNSKFPVDILVQADKSDEEQVRLSFTKAENILIDTLVNLDPIDGKGRVTLLVEANELGNQVYELVLSPIANELNLYNNKRTIAIEVVEQKHQVIMIYHSPNPDIRVIEETLTESGRFELTTWSIDQGVPDFDKYQVAIVYQIPTIKANDDAIMSRLLQSGINTLLMVGPGTSLQELENHIDIITFPNNRNSGEDFSGKLNEQFNLFLLPDNLSGFLSDMPPLRAPLSGIAFKSQSFVLLSQRIKGIDLPDPLIWFVRNGNAKIGFWWGEGLWRWNLFEYLIYGDNFYTKSLISAIVNYLTINEVYDPLKIDAPVSISSFEKLIWKARLYNESLELINYPNLYMDLILPDGDIRKMEFIKLDGKYWLELDQLIPGQYVYHCYTQVSDKEVRKSGVIQVIETPLENLDTKARFSDLKQLANLKGGHFYTMSQKSELLNYLGKLEGDDVPTYKESRWVNLLNWRYLLFIIIFLFSVEWILRRWSGTR